MSRFGDCESRHVKNIYRKKRRKKGKQGFGEAISRKRDEFIKVEISSFTASYDKAINGTTYRRGKETGSYPLTSFL
jgi:hypothetical protein